MSKSQRPSSTGHVVPSWLRAISVVKEDFRATFRLPDPTPLADSLSNLERGVNAVALLADQLPAPPRKDVSIEELGAHFGRIECIRQLWNEYIQLVDDAAYRFGASERHGGFLARSARVWGSFWESLDRTGAWATFEVPLFGSMSRSAVCPLYYDRDWQRLAQSTLIHGKYTDSSGDHNYYSILATGGPTVHGLEQLHACWHPPLIDTVSSASAQLATALRSIARDDVNPLIHRFGTSPTSSAAPLRSERWQDASSGKPPLCGWRAICKSLELPYGRNQRRYLKIHSETTQGPIKYSSRRPEVDEAQLHAWLRCIEQRAAAARATRASEKAAAKRIGEYGGQFADDRGLHTDE